MKNTIVILLLTTLVGCASGQAQKKLSATAFQNRLDSTDQPQLVDVRTPGEFESGHIEGAVNININDASFKVELNKMDKSKPVFLYCGSGVRSAKAANLAKDYGFIEVYDLEGGIGQWMTAKLPVQK